MNATATYTVEAATEYGIGTGPNGTGRRAKVSGWYVLNMGRKARAFTGKDAAEKAEAWAKFCNENFGSPRT